MSPYLISPLSTSEANTMEVTLLEELKSAVMLSGPKVGSFSRLHQRSTTCDTVIRFDKKKCGGQVFKLKKSV